MPYMQGFVDCIPEVLFRVYGFGFGFRHLHVGLVDGIPEVLSGFRVSFFSISEVCISEVCLGLGFLVKGFSIPEVCISEVPRFASLRFCSCWFSGLHP